MNIINQDKVKYIKNYFHQYMDITLNKNLDSNERVNVIIPISSLYGSSSAYSILLDYPDTDIKKEKEVYCTKVIDGDTIWVKDVESRNESTGEIVLNNNGYKVRFVGIDTPELEEGVTDKATEFVKQCCLNKFLYLNVDSKKEKDKYDRILAVVITYNKNLNEILLKEKLATVDYIPPSEFNPQDWNNDLRDTAFSPTKTNDLSDLSPFLNSDFNNVVFTPADNYDIIYPYEVYKGVFYLRTNPYSQNIRMHVFPRNYDCSDTILFLKDDMVSKQTVTKSNNYKIYSDKNNINAYYQENGADRDRNNITEKDYYRTDWGLDETNTFVEFSYDISEDTKSFNNLEICAGYRYNQTSPFYAVHYTGVKDNTNKHADDRATLLDTNVDKIGSKSNAVTQMSYKTNGTPDISDDTTYIRHDPMDNIRKYVGDINHVNDIRLVHHKKIKYINDMIYIEEDGVSETCEWTNPIE